MNHAAGNPTAMQITVVGCGYLGATHAAAMAELGHEVLGMEIDPAYGQVIIERWEAFTGEKALLDGKLPLSAIVRTRTRKAK